MLQTFKIYTVSYPHPKTIIKAVSTTITTTNSFSPKQVGVG
uniref:Uncharacterized protein n=1 Tax=Arundo donax TaxID=35708 RepID=A0A0A9AFU9_ARUDO